jgi:pilus assembly protein CpaF
MSALVDRVRDRLAAEGRDATPSAVAEAVRAEGGVIGDIAVHRLARELRDDLIGFGPLQAFVDDPEVTDVLVNAADEVWIDRGRGLVPVAERLFADAAEVRRLAVRLATAAGRRLDDASPCVDVRIGDGIRLHAVLPPVAPACALISVRVPRVRVMDLAALEQSGALGDGARAWLGAIVASRCAFLVSGGTGTGKTTLLTALLGDTDAGERLVLVEDASELRPRHPHVVRLEARPPNVEGAGAVSLRDLVRQALRMRPDRLVVGEARGEEIVDLLAALNTGHEGGCGTIHANSVDDVPARVVALAATGGLSRAAAIEQFAAAVDVVIHLDRRRDGQRRVRSIGVVTHDGRNAVAVEALQWDDAGTCRTGPGLNDLQRVVGRAR